MTFAHLLVGTVAVFGIYWTIKYLLMPKPPPPPPVKKPKTTTTEKAVTTETTDTEMTTETTAMTIAQTIAQIMSQNMTVTKPENITATTPKKVTETSTQPVTTTTTTTRSTKKTTTVPPWCGRATDYQHGRRCYRMFEPRTWLNARSYCEEEGGMLCNAFTRHEESHIKELFNKQPKKSFVLVAVGVRSRRWLNHYYDYDSSGRRIDRVLYHGQRHTTPDHHEFNCIGPMRQLSWVPSTYECHFICEYNYPFPRAP